MNFMSIHTMYSQHEIPSNKQADICTSLKQQKDTLPCIVRKFSCWQLMWQRWGLNLSESLSLLLLLTIGPLQPQAENTSLIIFNMKKYPFKNIVYVKTPFMTHKSNFQIFFCYRSHAYTIKHIHLYIHLSTFWMLIS